MRRVIRFVLILLAISALLPLAVSAQPTTSLTSQTANLSMEVRAGFDGYCRTAAGGRWCPFYIVLANEGADITGELQIAVGNTGGSEPDRYVAAVMLPSHSRKAYFLYIPPNNTASNVTVFLYSGPRVLDSQTVTLSWLGEKDRLYGVASGDLSALNFLVDVAPAGGKAAVARVNLDMLPPDPLAWEALDVLIVSDVDTTVLSREQRKALEIWISQGGQLIVGGGAGAARTAAGLADLLPTTIGATRSVDNLRALDAQFGLKTAPGPYAVADSTLRDGSALIVQDGLILLARRPHGAGQVDFLAFDAAINPFGRWEDNKTLWRFIAGPVVVNRQRIAVRMGGTARDAVNSIPGLVLPSTWQIIGFMLLYTILIGPVNYIILRKMDRRELAWFTIPTLILVFTACAYMTGFQVRGAQAIVHQMAVLYTPENTRIGRITGVVGVFSPRRTFYNLQIPGSRVRALSDAYYSGSANFQPLRIYEETDRTRVRDLRVDVGGIRPFLVERYAEAPKIEADLRLVGGQRTGLALEGKIRIGETPLKGAVLLVGRQEQRLGDLAAGAVVDVNIPCSSYGTISASGLPGRILGAGPYGGNDELSRQYRFLQALFPGDGPGLGDGGYLIGWSDEPVLPVEVEERSSRTIATTLYIYSLPVEALEAGTEVEIPPSLISRQVEKTDGAVNTWDEGFGMGQDSQIVLRFTVWQGVLVRQVDKVTLELQGRHAGRMPKVSLWNVENAAWEEIPIGGWGKHALPNGAAYIIPPGELLLRMETGAGDWVNVDTVAITIKGQR